MGIYNCEKTLKEAVGSIQAQTYANWELILCDDGSSDGTLCVAKELAESDDRILVTGNRINEGLNRSLNKCLALASGTYIARMDGDDISMPDRFEQQVGFLETHSEFDIVSSWMELFDETGTWGEVKTPEYPSARNVVLGTPICHAPAMIRKKSIDEVGGYSEDPETLRVEDVDLWIRLYKTGHLCYNIQNTLYRMRNDRNAFNRRKYKYRINSSRVRIRGCKDFQLGAGCYLRSLKPMLIGLIPGRIRHFFRKQRYRTS